MSQALGVSWRLGAEELTPPNVLIITARELKEGAYGYDFFDILAALRIKTGITVKSSSDVGAEDWLLIRGLPRDSSRNILVLIDGLPLNDALSESNEFEHIPLFDLIEKIIVYKPPIPVRFGGYTAAIEILTKGRPEEYKTEISGALGEYKSGFSSILTEGLYKIFFYRINLDYIRTDNLTGVRRTPPKNNIVYGDRSYWKIRSAAKLMYNFAAASQLSFYTQYVENDKFFSDEIFRGEKERRDRRLINFNLNYQWNPWKESNLLLSLFRADESYKLNLMMHPSVRDQDRYKQGIRLRWDFALPAKQRVSIGGDVTNLHTEEKLGTLLSLTDASFYSLYVEDQITPLENINLNLGLRLDNHSEAKLHWNPYISVVFKPFGSTFFFGIWGKSTRWPSLSEFDEKNPQIGLEGEELETFEFGVNQGIGKNIFAKLSVFRLELEKESKFFMDVTRYPPLMYQRNELDKVRSNGIEAEIDFSITENLRGFLDYTFNKVEKTPGGESIDYGGPQNLANIGMIYVKGRGNLNITARYGSKAKGVQRMMGSPTQLSDWLIIDLVTNLETTKNLDLFIRVSNLFDRQYETFDGRPMFGRTVIGGLSVEF